MKVYRITNILGGIDTSVNPPAIVLAVWPSFNGWTVTLSSTECLVTVPDSAPAPADLGPLVKVEQVS